MRQPKTKANYMSNGSENRNPRAMWNLSANEKLRHPAVENPDASKGK